MKRVYDCFTFFNEIEILKIRFEELHDLVDFFVVCESTTTFQGQAKPLHFDQNRHLFAPFLDKVIHVVVPDMPTDGSQVWQREYFQRDALRRGLATAQSDDIIIISDCDEVVSRSAVERMRQREGYFLLDMAMYQFHLNMQSHASGWTRPFAYSYSLSPEIGDFSYHRLHDESVFRRFGSRAHRIDHAGWHFTFLGGADAVAQKLRAYSHVDGWHRRMRDGAALDSHLAALIGADSHIVLKFRPLDETFPRHVVENRSHYEKLGLVKTSADRVAELETAYQHAYDANRRLSSKVEILEGEIIDLKRLARRARWTARADTVNLIPSSSDFGRGWTGTLHGEAMRNGAGAPDGAFGPADIAMRHDPDAASHASGRYGIAGLRTGLTHAVSCYVYLSRESRATRVAIACDGKAVAVGAAAVTAKLDEWQRVWTRFEADGLMERSSAWLAVDAEGPVLSSCWQIEEGPRPTRYRRTAVPNLLHRPDRFGIGWHVGFQATPNSNAHSGDVPRLYPLSVVMRHRLDGTDRNPDGNVGFYELPVSPGHAYTGSAWVWVPRDFAGRDIQLSLGEWLGQTQVRCDLARRDAWQRITATATAPDDVRHARVVLRVTSDGPTDLYSTAWKLERDAPASLYADAKPRLWHALEDLPTLRP